MTGKTPARLHAWLAEGDLRSDGLAPEVAALVLGNPSMLPDLLAALADGSDVVRGHAADAIERLSRQRPEMLVPHLDAFISQSSRDPVPMVRWHLAMLLGNLTADKELVGSITEALLPLLEDPSPFVKSWAISSVCQIGRQYPLLRDQLLPALAALQRDRSIAVRHRAGKAMRLLLNSSLPLPSGWVKSKGK